MARILMEPFSRALVLENPNRSLEGFLAQAGIASVWRDSVADSAELIDEINRTGAQLLFKRSRVKVPREVLEACPSLHAIQLCCIGDDSIDKEACADNGVLIFNDPVSNGRSVVELAIGHMVALSRRLYETDLATHEGKWDKTNQGRYEILGKTLGIVGLGNIGRQIARLGEHLGMDVLFYDSRPVAQEVGLEMGWQSMDTVSDLMRGSDIVTVHTSAKDHWGRDNANFLSEYLCELGLNRPDNSPRLFLNLARGNLYSAEALLDAVKLGQVRRAAVDVYPEEPHSRSSPWSNPYAEEPRIVCTPHIGAATQEAQPRIARRVAGTITGFSRFGSLRDCVFAPKAQLSLRDQARGHAVLAVVHSVSRGTKKAVDDAIYEANASNLGSTHRDFPIGVAYDLSVMDRPLRKDELDELVKRAADLAQDERAVRAIRQIEVPKKGW